MFCTCGEDSRDLPRPAKGLIGSKRRGNIVCEARWTMDSPKPEGRILRSARRSAQGGGCPTLPAKKPWIVGDRQSEILPQSTRGSPARALIQFVHRSRWTRWSLVDLFVWKETLPMSWASHSRSGVRFWDESRRRVGAKSRLLSTCRHTGPRLAWLLWVDSRP
jgi:hypothetical protein